MIFLTRAAAERSADVQARKLGRQLYVYRCPGYDHWHLATVPRFRKHRR